jgi:serine/threonine-protein kinase
MDASILLLRPELAAAIGAERFIAEIKLTARLNHPHILPLLDSDEAGGFIPLEWQAVMKETLACLDRYLGSVGAPPTGASP